jgi:hypothetical protein
MHKSPRVTLTGYKGVVGSSVADPDPYVFGPPGSGTGSISQRYGSGSGSFCHKENKQEKHISSLITPITKLIRNQQQTVTCIKEHSGT